MVLGEKHGTNYLPYTGELPTSWFYFYLYKTNNLCMYLIIHNNSFHSDIFTIISIYFVMSNYQDLHITFYRYIK